MIFTTKQTGDKGEAYAAKYLKKHKYKIIARNYKKPYGEIDIIDEVPCPFAVTSLIDTFLPL